MPDRIASLATGGTYGMATGTALTWMSGNITEISAGIVAVCTIITTVINAWVRLRKGK